jgi:cell division protein FtsZ
MGIERLRAEVDTLIVIPNDRLLSISDRHVSVLDAFKAADQVLLSGVQGITDLITTPGLINLDFADVKSVMSGAGSALMGIGSARGDDRAVAAAEMAISSPLLEASIDGAHGVLLSIQGGSDLGLFEINEAAQLVANSAAPDANIIFGAVIDDALGDEVRVTVIAAGFDEAQAARARSARAGGYGSGPASPDVLAASGGWRTFSFPDRAEPGTATPAHSPDQAVSPAAAQAAGPLAAPVSGQPAQERTAGQSATAAAANQEPARVDGVPPLRPADVAASGPSPASGSAAARPDRPAPRPDDAAARVADGSTRRRSVVFEEDDELDVPDFLK